MSEDQSMPIISEEVQAKIYDDIFHSLAEELGTTLKIPFELINIALSKPRIWIEKNKIKYAQAIEDIKNEVRYLPNPETDLVEPESYVVLPALESFNYSIDNDEIRELYTKLLSKSIVKEIKDFVHPAYVEVVKQMSPNDAKLFKYLNEDADNIGLLKLCVKFKDKGPVFSEEVGSIEFGDSTNFSLSITSLERLGLIKVNKTDKESPSLEKYEKVRATSVYKQYLEDTKGMKKGIDLSKGKMNEIKHTIVLTAFGREFYKICVMSAKEFIEQNND